VISPILASKMGYGQASTGNLLGIDALTRNPDRLVPDVVPADQNFLMWDLARQVVPGPRTFCQLESGVQRDFALASIIMAGGEDADQTEEADAPSSSPSTPAEKGNSKSADKKRAEPAKPKPRDELPESFLGQAIKIIVMHEVGHSLGLRHNFK